LELTSADFVLPRSGRSSRIELTTVVTNLEKNGAHAESLPDALCVKSDPTAAGRLTHDRFYRSCKRGRGREGGATEDKTSMRIFWLSIWQPLPFWLFLGWTPKKSSLFSAPKKPKKSPLGCQIGMKWERGILAVGW
jgi:hypothetical protein